MTPQQFVAGIAAGRKPYLDGFHIAFDHWHSTDAPENHALAQDIYRALRKNELIEVRTIEQFFDPDKGMFLPDRFIKGECPKCGAKDQYGDNCEVCGAVYAPTDLKNPYSALSGATPVLKTSEHFFFKLSRPALRRVPGRLDAGRPPAARGGQQGQGMVHARRRRQGRPRRLGHQPRRALLRHRDPRRAGQVLLRLARRAGGLPGLAEEPGSASCGHRLRRLPGRPGGGAGALHRQGHRHLPHAVLAGDAEVQRPQGARPHLRARPPHRQRREDEQEPRHRHQPAEATWSWA